MFNNSIILVTGGTGSFGNAFVSMTLKKFNPKKLIIFSRDEMKQWEMSKKFASDKRIRFFIGDVRDKDRLNRALQGVDYVVHAAATKIVPIAEYNPFECVKTNINGAMNLIDAAINQKVKKVVALSTDKASSPINLYGATKLASDKLFVASNESYASGHHTSFSVVRYGNVMGSRGSVIPLFDKQISEGKPITVTDKDMTRFMMTLDDAVDLVIHTFNEGNNGDIFVQKSPASTIENLVNAILSIKEQPDYEIKEIGTRHGEKSHEVLCSREEMFVARDEERYFRIPVDERDLNYEKYFEVGVKETPSIEEYSSDNTERLDKDGMIKLLKKLPLYKS